MFGIRSMHRFYLFILLFTSVLLTGCVTVVDAVSSESQIQPDPTKRSFGEYWDDKQLRTIVSVNLRKADPAFNKLNVNVYSYKSVVLLTGDVPTKKLRDLAGETARKINRVRQVYNELHIGVSGGFLDGAEDALLGTKIKSKLFAYKDIDSSRVEVFVENNTVYLMGLLSRAQTEKITNVVRKQKGVKKVVRAIEYID